MAIATRSSNTIASMGMTKTPAVVQARTVYSRVEQHDQPGVKGAGTLRVEVDVQHYLDFNSCKRLEVSFLQKLGKAKKHTEIGYMVGFFVDKTMKADGTTSDTSKNGLWAQELIKRDDGEGEDQTHGVREASRILFTKAGTVRATMRHLPAELAADQFFFVDTYLLYPKCRMPGAGAQPMRMLLSLLPEVLGRKAGFREASVPCILCTAKLTTVPLKEGKTLKDVEEGLKRSYARNGFQLWLQGNPEIKGTITVMGRLV